MGTDKEEKLALKVLCTLLGKKEALIYVYEEHKVTIWLQSFVGLVLPVHVMRR